MMANWIEDRRSLAQALPFIHDLTIINRSDDMFMIRSFTNDLKYYPDKEILKLLRDPAAMRSIPKSLKEYKKKYTKETVFTESQLLESFLFFVQLSLTFTKEKLTELSLPNGTWLPPNKMINSIIKDLEQFSSESEISNLSNLFKEITANNSTTVG